MGVIYISFPIFQKSLDDCRLPNYDFLKQLSNEGEISEQFLPSFSFLHNLGNSLKHWSEDTPHMFESGKVIHLQNIIMRELFENILPDLID